MARGENPPFARGETYYNGGTIDSTNLGGPNLEGKEFVFEVNDPDDPVMSDPSGRHVRVRVVRNVSGGNLKPSRIAHYKTPSSTVPAACQVDGYCYAVGDRPAGVIDEFLPAAGVPNNDLFYLVIEGPTIVQQTHTSFGSITAGTRLVPTAGGAASVTDDLGGRVLAQDLTGATATLANNVQNQIGFAAAASNAADALFAAYVSIPNR